MSCVYRAFMEPLGVLVNLTSTLANCQAVRTNQKEGSSEATINRVSQICFLEQVHLKLVLDLLAKPHSSASWVINYHCFHGIPVRQTVLQLTSRKGLGESTLTAAPSTAAQQGAGRTTQRRNCKWRDRQTNCPPWTT